MRSLPPSLLDPWCGGDSGCSGYTIALRCLRDITLCLNPYFTHICVGGRNSKLPQLKTAITELASDFPELQPPILTQDKLSKAIALLTKDQSGYIDQGYSVLDREPGLCDVLIRVLVGVQCVSYQRKSVRIDALCAGLCLFGGEMKFGRMVRFYQSVAKDINAR